ncbi:MAG: hypothetical protein RBR14_06525 [Candidatus Cloacimonas acidaminovorans]|nr:hypothetical protein [Candidatus Cloacimonas acidaminovorans]
MNNIQWQILSKLINMLSTISVFKYIGLYPDDIEFIGKNYPAIILIDGEESNHSCLTGNRITFDYQVSILIIDSKEKGSRIKSLLEYQNAIKKLLWHQENIIESEDSLAYIMGSSVEKGDINNYNDITALGYLTNISVRKINVVYRIETNI